MSLYISDLAEQGRKVSTIRRRLSAIKMFVESQGFDNPTSDPIVKAAMKGIQRDKGTPPEQKKPLLSEDIQKMIAVLPDSLIGIRDRSLLLLGFAGAYRRSELVALDVEDIEFNKDGLVVMLRRSKTESDSGRVQERNSLRLEPGDLSRSCAAGLD